MLILKNLLAKARPRHSDFLIYSAILIIGFLLYFKSLYFDFTYLDDNVLILNNVQFLQNPWNIFVAFSQDVFHVSFNSASYYRPLLTLSFMPEAIIGGASPFLYHLVNIMIHLVGSCLAFKIFRKLNFSKTTSSILAFIFLVHPALAQAVSWIPGRNDSLLGVFVFACFILFLNFIEKKRARSLIWHGVFFVLAIFTKETALILPAVCLVYIWALGLLKKNILIKLGAIWIVALLLWMPLRHFALNGPGSITAKEAASSAIKNSPAAIQILGKAFFPFNLSVLPIIEDTTFIFGFLALGIVSFLIWFEIKNRQTDRRNLRVMLFAASWFVLFLWPSFIKADSSNPPDFLEHRLYVPMIGLLIFIAKSSAMRISEARWKNKFIIFWIFAVTGFFIINFSHQNNFSGKLSFWQNAATHSPHSSLAQKNLGAMYYLEKNYSLSEEYSKKALEINPYETMAHNNLGLAYAATGRLLEAEKEYLKELSFNYSYDSAHYNLGLLYYHAGFADEAKKEWEKTLEINPDYKDAKIMLDTLNAK